MTSGREKLRDRLARMKRDVLPELGSGVAQAGVVAGLGAEAAPFAAFIPAIFALVTSLWKGNAQRELELALRRLEEVEDRLNQTLDLEFIFGPAFAAEFRRLIDLTAKEVHEAKLEAARNHLVRKAFEGPQSDQIATISQMVDRYIDVLPPGELATIQAMKVPPPNIQRNFRSPELDTLDELASQLGYSLNDMEIILQDLAGQKLVYFFGSHENNNIVHGPKKSAVWGLSPMGSKVKERIARL